MNGPDKTRSTRAILAGAVGCFLVMLAGCSCGPVADNGSGGGTVGNGTSTSKIIASWCGGTNLNDVNFDDLTSDSLLLTVRDVQGNGVFDVDVSAFTPDANGNPMLVARGRTGTDGSLIIDLPLRPKDTSVRIDLSKPLFQAFTQIFDPVATADGSVEATLEIE